MAEGVGRGGSDLGRPAIDWEQAFAFYASLPAERRSYQAVADKFGVSVRTVPLGSLPRYEGKGKRFEDRRK